MKTPMNRWMVEGIWADVYDTMISLESDETEKALIHYLRQKGYTIIEPDNEND